MIKSDCCNATVSTPGKGDYYFKCDKCGKGTSVHKDEKK